MKDRCYYRAHTEKFSNYGGIKICERWLNSFANFLADMGPKPSSKYSLDRYPNTNGDYEPGNCRWATQFEQTLNQRRSRRIPMKASQLIIEIRNAINIHGDFNIYCAPNWQNAIVDKVVYLSVPRKQYRKETKCTNRSPSAASRLPFTNRAK